MFDSPFPSIYTPPGGPPQVKPPHLEIYQIMGEENIFRMLRDFYEELHRSPITGMFAQDPLERQAAADKSACFFVGLLGGPPLFHEKYGPPMLRRRHFPFYINQAVRQQWLDCFLNILDNAPEKYNFPAEHLQGFKDFLVGFSTWMINKAG